MVGAFLRRLILGLVIHIPIDEIISIFHDHASSGKIDFDKKLDMLFIFGKQGWDMPPVHE